MVAQERKGEGMEPELLIFKEERAPQESEEDGLDMVKMFLGGLGENADVNQVHEDETTKHVLEHISHQCLETLLGC